MRDTSTNRTQALINRAALAIGTLYALTTIHHVYGGLVDGIAARLMIPVIMAVPLAASLGLLYLYRRTGRWLALTGFSVVTVLIFVLLLGVLHGGYAHTYKDILFLLNGSPSLYYSLNPQEHYPPDNLFFELTGILEMVTAFFVARSVYRLIRDRQQRPAVPAASTRQTKAA